MKFTVEYFDDVNNGFWDELESFSTLEEAYAAISDFQAEDVEEEQSFSYRIVEGRVIHVSERF